MSSAASPTIGELFLILSEMGFTEEQIQLAVQAGHFSVPEAAEWLLQGQYPRHRLVKQSPQPAETAISAFNPPKEAASTSQTHASPTENKACPSLVLRPSQSCPLSPEPLPVESRIKQDKSDFAEQERLRVAQEAREERRQKKQERELVLKRIAEDRKKLQEKIQTSTVTETTPPSGEAQKLGGKIQTNVDNNCILMIRLPSGESMRERFPADAPLRSVMEHIIGRYPSLPPFSLLQGFPRKRFGEADLACSLHSLGLTPNAALCIQTTPPETPQDPQSPAEPPSAGQNEPSPCSVPPYPHLPAVEEAVGQDLVLPPPLPNQLWEEAVNYAGMPGIGQPLSGPSHFWGRGQRLVPDNAEEGAEIEVDEEEEGEEEPPQLLNGNVSLGLLQKLNLPLDLHIA